MANKHGRAPRGRREQLYWIWCAMRQRCNNPNNKGYHNYGARGIQRSPEWDNYEPFRDWALSHGYAPDLDLDRRDNDGNYCPENCRFVTRQVNTRNMRKNTLIMAFGEKRSIYEWLEDERCQCKTRQTLYMRLRLGWSEERALTTPIRPITQHQR